MTYASGLPMTDRERDACERQRKRVVAKGVNRRKACPDKRRYNRPGTPADKRLRDRILGERDD
jgi:hypothetical protein